jgi:antitoxin component YwqK of YwqJK toxin-antitoxin module
MKKIILALILTGFFTTVNAQRQYVFFLKNNEREVKEKDSADFIRIVQEPDSGDVNFKLLEYYPSGTRKTIGYTSTVVPVTYEGPYASYYRNGKKKDIIRYNAGMLDGLGYHYFNNGTLRSQIDYSTGATKFRTELNFFTKEKVIYMADSAGNIMVKDGNGHFVDRTYQKNGDVITTEGDYKDGLKSGEWKLKCSANDYWYKEQFEEGRMIIGESYCDGKTYNYTQLEIPAKFKGGSKDFDRYLKRMLKYPSDAKSNRIKGIVFLSFVIEKDGCISDVRVDRYRYGSFTSS